MYPRPRPRVSYCEYFTDVVMPITTTPTKVINWGPSVPPVGFSEVDGVFTCHTPGTYTLHLERIYRNTDSNPTVVVNITLEVVLNGVVVLQRSSPISSATSPNEPAILSFSTPGILPAKEGDFFYIRVYGEDGGADPNVTTLHLMKFTAHSI